MRKRARKTESAASCAGAACIKANLRSGRIKGRGRPALRDVRRVEWRSDSPKLELLKLERKTPTLLDAPFVISLADEAPTAQYKA
jgi:hypothetical protein